MLDFEGRVAVITGAGQGMGRAHAKALAARGARVVINDVNAANAAAVVHEVTLAGGTAVADTNNVVKAADHVVRTAIDTFGRLDIAVANAGIVKFGLFAEQSVDDFWSVFDVSFKGTVDLARAAWPHLAESSAGRLILVSSSGMLASPGMSAYGAAKAAIWGLGNTLAVEGDRVGIQVTTIMPTAWTPMTESGFTDPTIVATLRDLMSADKVAAFVTYLAHQSTLVHGDFFQIGGSHAGRLTLSGLPRVFVENGTAEEWASKSSDLQGNSNDVEQYRLTGTQFAGEMIASNPALKGAFEGTNPADVSGV